MDNPGGAIVPVRRFLDTLHVLAEEPDRVHA